MSSKAQKLLVFSSLALVLTPFWVLLAYMNWQYTGVDFELAVSDFQKWPWIKASVVMALVSYLYSYYAHYQFVYYAVRIEESAAIYSLLYIWGFFFIFYPGSDAFGGSDGNSWFWMMGILITHYFTVKLTAQQLINSEGS